MKRLASRLPRRVQAWRGRHVASIPWFTIYDGGVVVALDAPRQPDEIRISIRIDDGAEQVLPVSRMARIDDVPLALTYFSSDLLASASRCTLTVSTKGRLRREQFTIGPGRYAGHVSGLRDYCLEGWVSPLFPTANPMVQLVVDGVAEEPRRLDRHHPELMPAGSQGGWNGFRLPLPPGALDGQPHHLAVRAGETVFEFGAWAPRPLYDFDYKTLDCLAGWYFDEAAGDFPTSIRIEKDGVTTAVLKTGFRPDLKAAFGRDCAGYNFHDVEIEPGSTLIAGPEGAGMVVGRLGKDLIARVDARRAEARALLLGQDTPTETLAARRTIRNGIVATERTTRLTDLSFRPAGPSPSVPADIVRDLAPTGAPPVCAIVPVYNGLSDLRLCLASLIPQLRDGRLRAIVIDDGSPDPEVGRYLSDLDAKRHPGLTILTNAANSGFIATVNRCLTLLEAGEDVLLLNADTIVPPGVVEKLANHAHGQPGIATVTPMSNNATILSFPRTTERNGPALGLDVAVIDDAFASEARAPAIIPTGVGFCMYINRLALDEVGLLSPEWGRGYCEEVDWCLTARDLGWVHLAATDTFVIHEGSVSFTTKERLAILATNHVRLEALYPEYMDEVRAFERADPFADLRIGVLSRLLRGRFRHLTLHVTHGWGGGTRRYVEDLCALPRGTDQEIAVLSPAAKGSAGKPLTLAFDGAGLALTLDPGRVESMLAAIEAGGATIMIHVNSRLIFGSDFLTHLLSGARPYVVMLHDFQWYCPRVHLADRRMFYCGEPPVGVCQHCVSEDVGYDFGDQDELINSDLESWIGFNTGILKGATRLLAPSQDTADRYARRLGLDGIVVVPHPEPPTRDALPIATREAAPRRPLRLAVVGAIGRHKGLDLLRRMVEHTARNRIPFFLTVIGYIPDDAFLESYGNAKVTGKYRPSELQDLLAEADPDFVFLPSVWPETYSYVLSEVWQAGHPVVAFDFGAPAERIRAVGGGVLIPPSRDTRAVLDSLMEARRELAAIRIPPAAERTAATLDAYYRQSEAGSVPWPLATEARRIAAIS
ncbi:glycosyltransferase [uncultured Methylobacterium sp.]|uniref:glycosyltransferase n=1 Tax=uncultured Methylobacterium sp. TaxID=157278 RepID=UPI0035CC1A52